MKIIEKISLAIFSIIILLEALIACLMTVNWIKLSTITYYIQIVLANPAYTNILLVTSIVLTLLAIKCIFFSSDKGEKEKVSGILLENESGRLIISVETIQNLVKSVMSGFPSVQLANCKVMLDKQTNNVKISMKISVTSETVIKELSLNIQNRIKEVVKNSTDLEIKQIDIDVKDIVPAKETNE